MIGAAIRRQSGEPIAQRKIHGHRDENQVFDAIRQVFAEETAELPDTVLFSDLSGRYIAQNEHYIAVGQIHGYT